MILRTFLMWSTRASAPKTMISALSRLVWAGSKARITSYFPK
jgi:hypothetical protein